MFTEPKPGNLATIADEIERHIADGYIRSVTHRSGQLRILNYTPQTQYSRHWNVVTLQCRGLIVDNDWNVVARPYPKFFNWSELDGPTQTRLAATPPMRIADKLDGSLGIVYTDPDTGQTSVATRGSFTSEQAEWATQWLRHHMPDLRRLPSETPLTEIIYPGNRIVVDYDWEGLVLLDSLDTITGHMLDDDESVARNDWVDYGGRLADTFPAHRMVDVLAGEGPLPDDGTAEGYVVTWPDGTRVKVKLGEYVRLHRIVTGVNARHIWERLANADQLPGRDALADILDRVPDEFYDWADGWVTRLTTAHRLLHDTITRDFQFIAETVGTHDRKAFALAAVGTDHPAALFATLDGHEDKVDQYVWRRLKPDAESPFRQDIDA